MKFCHYLTLIIDILIQLEGAHASTDLCVDVAFISSGVMIGLNESN